MEQNKKQPAKKAAAKKAAARKDDGDAASFLKELREAARPLLEAEFPVRAMLGLAGPNDAVFVFELRVVGSDGREISAARGLQTLPGIMAEAAAPDAVARLQAVMEASVSAPLLGDFHKATHPVDGGAAARAALPEPAAEEIETEIVDGPPATPVFVPKENDTNETA